MLGALIFFTFVAGVFTGIGILAMIFAYLVNKDENKKFEQNAVNQARLQMAKVRNDPSIPTQGPILTD